MVSPPSGGLPEVVGSILIRLLTGKEAPAMESQIRVAYEDSDRQMPVRFMKTEFEMVVADGDVSLEPTDSSSRRMALRNN